MKHPKPDNERRVRQLRAGETEELKELYTHYRDTCTENGGSATWSREASQLILTLLEERESFKARAQASGLKERE